MDSGSVCFIMICSALVFLMTPALAFFYGGLVRRKNVLNTMMATMFICGTAIVMWILFGYSFSFGSDNAGLVGGFDFIGLNNVSITESSRGLEIPDMLFCIFQMMFAIITPALITGAVAGRMKFKTLVPFICLWSLIVYYPMAHMVWGGGFMGSAAEGGSGLFGTGIYLNSIDFAGGNVVHISSGITGLVLAIILGQRKGYEKNEYRPHNIPFVLLGAALLWFGWFGFNAGSALAANGTAVHAFITTAVSSAVALISWMIIDTITSGKPTLVGCSTGLVVGLVAITPGAGYVPVWAAIIIGLLVSPICYFGVHLVKKIFKIDDALDAFGCHGIGGIWGGIATGIFAVKEIAPGVESGAQWNGLIFGDYHLFVAQLLSIIVTIAFAIIGTLVCVGIVKLFAKKLRVDEMDERIGLDMTQHGEQAYPSFNGLD
ncbi:MAG: ammonium transporter [Acutalibacteraceae bacterium]|nr:ammonium transporter [Acutalibacteraceae bacterium]